MLQFITCSLQIELAAHQFNQKLLEYLAPLIPPSNVTKTQQQTADTILHLKHALQLLLNHPENTLLAQSYTQRSSIWQQVILPSVYPVSSVLAELAQAEYTIDEQIIALNRTHELPHTQLENYIAQLNSILKSCKQALSAYLQTSSWHTQQEQTLKKLWQQDYHQAYRLQHQTLLLTSWYQYLAKAQQTLQARYPSSSFNYQLAIKRLLTSVKSWHYTEINQHLHSYTIAKLWHQKLNLTELNQALLSWETKVHKLEHTLLRTMAPNPILINTVSLWTGSYYYIISDTYFQALNEMSLTKLEPSFQQFFTACGSILLAGIDYNFMGWHGLRYAFINALNQYFLNDITTLLQLGADLHLTTNLTLKIVPLLKNTISLGIYLGVYGLLLGSENLGLLASGYVAAKSFSHLMGYLTKNLAPSNRYQLFIKTPLQHIASILGHKIGFSLYTQSCSFFTRTPPANILADPKLCFANQEACRALALEVLELPKTATKTDITAQFHRLAIKYHPDINPRNSPMLAYNQARTRLKELAAPQPTPPGYLLS